MKRQPKPRAPIQPPWIKQPLDGFQQVLAEQTELEIETARQAGLRLDRATAEAQARAKILFRYQHQRSAKAKAQTRWARDRVLLPPWALEMIWREAGKKKDSTLITAIDGEAWERADSNARARSKESGKSILPHTSVRREIAAVVAARGIKRRGRKPVC